MSITDELRERIDAVCRVSGWDCKRLTAIADRIDAEHESACAEAYGNGVQSVALPDLTAYVKMPVDAEGKPIRIGDVMEWVRYKDDDPTIVRTVSGIGNGVFFAWSDEQGRYAQYEAHAYRHHHAPTVEDVLHSFICDVEEDVRDEREIIAEYAAKLQLRCDGE